jgi:hypothetical protein
MAAVSKKGPHPGKECTNFCMRGNCEGVKLAFCFRCKLVWYCGTSLQAED